MTTFKAKFRGNTDDLKMLLACGITDYSSKSISQNNMTITWICESDDIEDVMNSISLREVSVWNCELVNFA